MEKKVKEAPIKNQKLRRKALISIGIFLYVLVIIISAHYAWALSVENTTKQAVNLATSIQATLPKRYLEILVSNPRSKKNINLSVYNSTKDSLEKLVELNKDVNSAYIYTYGDDRVRLLAHSANSNTSASLSKWHEKLSNNYSTLLEPFEGVEPYTIIPQSGDNGMWVNILVPIKNIETGKVLAVLGVEYPREMWGKCIFNNIMLIVAFTFVLLMILLSYFELLSRNSKLKEQKKSVENLNYRLYEREELFRMMFHQSPMGIAFCSSKRHVLSCNKRFEEILGRTKEELGRISYTKTTHPDVLKMDSKQFKKMVEGEIETYTLQKRYVKPDGSHIWTSATFSPLKIHTDNKFRYICILEDITDRLETEAIIREQERSKSVLFSNLPGMAYRCDFDRDWTMQLVSEGCFELTGYKPEGLIGNKELSYNDIISPHIREYLWEEWGKVLRKKEVFKEEYEIITASGETKWVFEQGRGVYDEDGQVVAIEGLIIDITESKKKDEEIRYLHYHDSLTGLYNREGYNEGEKLMDLDVNLPLSVIVADIDGLKLINDAFGHSEGDKLIKKVSEIFKKCFRKDDFLARTGGDDFTVMLPKTSNAELENLIKSLRDELNSHRADLAHSSVSLGWATKTTMDEKLDDIMNSALSQMYQQKLLESRSIYGSIIASIKTTLFEKCQETEEHAERLVDLSKEIGIAMNLKEEQLSELELLSTLHDIGKIGISDTVLKKPGKLNDEEWDEMKKHPEIGYRIVMSSQELYPIADYILTHHERWDGNGYPQGIKGEDIPLLSRILAVVDAYDAMTKDRTYRKAMSKENAIKEIVENSGTQFDPHIAEIFIKVLENEDD